MSIGLLKDYRQVYKDRSYDKGKGSLYNSWRSKVYTVKGKKAGFPDSWKTFKGFCDNIPKGWEKGKVLIRKDSSKPYSKDNCVWANKGEESVHRITASLGYDGQEKTLFEWSNIYGLNYNGVRQRYYKGKNYTNEQILFGKSLGKKKSVKDYTVLSSNQKIRNKASKMLSQYKLKDKKKGYKTDVDLDFLLSAFKQPCTYCGSNNKIGLDRKDNSQGHTKENCVPSCYRCNVVRGNNFSFDEMIILAQTIKRIDNDRKTKK